MAKNNVCKSESPENLKSFTVYRLAQTNN